MGLIYSISLSRYLTSPLHRRYVSKNIYMLMCGSQQTYWNIFRQSRHTLTREIMRGSNTKVHIHVHILPQELCGLSCTTLFHSQFRASCWSFNKNDNFMFNYTSSFCHLKGPCMVRKRVPRILVQLFRRSDFRCRIEVHRLRLTICVSTSANLRKLLQISPNI